MIKQKKKIIKITKKKFPKGIVHIMGLNLHAIKN